MAAITHYLNGKTQDWLYGEWNEDKFTLFTALYSVPGIRQQFDYLLDLRRSQEYLDRYGMDYSDIHDPRKLFAAQSGAAVMGYGTSMISKNIDKLYR